MARRPMTIAATVLTWAVKLYPNGVTDFRDWPGLLAGTSEVSTAPFLNGGHGFGMNPTHDTSRHFIDEFYWWMESPGLTRKPGDAGQEQRPDRRVDPAVVDQQVSKKGAGGRE